MTNKIQPSKLSEAHIQGEGHMT